MSQNDEHVSQYKWNNIKKLALGIIAFEGTEHLYNIISELRDCVDQVYIGMQKVSYHGDSIPQKDYLEIIRLQKEDHLVDQILNIETDITQKPRVQETQKRNTIIEYAEKQGCSHIIVIDSDEYYTKSSFLRGLKAIDEHDYEQTYCQYVNYYHDYQHFLKYPFKDGMYVPFVTKTKYRHSFECSDFTLPSDPTRRFIRPKKTVEEKNIITGAVQKKDVYTVEYHIFPWNEVKMHHLSWIRQDIRKKLNMWSSKTLFDNYHDLIDKAVYNFQHFEDHEDAAQQAIMLFNTPGNKVDIGEFPKQYIHPKADIHTRVRNAKEYKRILFVNMLPGIESDNNLFETLEQCCRNTWGKDIIAGKKPNCQYYAIAGTYKDSYIDDENHIVYVKNHGFDNDYMEMFGRYNKGIKLLEEHGIKYDYIVRGNSSTWINVDVMEEFLADETNDSILYGFKLGMAFWSQYNLYATGNLMVFSKRNQEIIQKVSEENNFNEVNTVGDDILLSNIFYGRCLQLNLPQNEYLMSLGGKNLKETYNNTDFGSIDFNCIGYQFKTFDVSPEIRKEDDVKKVMELHSRWIKTKKNMDIPGIAKHIREHIINEIFVIDCGKDKWVEMSEAEKQKQQFIAKIIKNQEFFTVKKQLATRDNYLNDINCKDIQ